MRTQAVKRIGSLAITVAIATGTLVIGGSAPPVAAAPVNDDWANATDVSGLVAPPADPALPGVSIVGTTSGSTRQAGEPDIGGATGLGTVWYRYTAPAGSRGGLLGYRVAESNDFAAVAYSPYVQINQPVGYPGDGVASLGNMQRVTTSGYDPFGILPGQTSGGFLPVVRVEPGESVWFQVSANPGAATPTDGAFTFELFNVADRMESIGFVGIPIGCANPDPFGCLGLASGDTFASSPKPIGSAPTWVAVTDFGVGTMSITVRSQTAGWRASTRPVSASLYLHPSLFATEAELGAPIATAAGAVEIVDGADYGVPGSTSQWVTRIDGIATSSGVFHIKIEGDPTFVDVRVDYNPGGAPSAAINDPSDGSSYATPAGVPALSYSCTASPGRTIASETVTVDGAPAAATDPLPIAPGAHVVGLSCVDDQGVTGTASATYTVAAQLVVPDQVLTVPEDSFATLDLLAAVIPDPGNTVQLDSITPAAHGSTSLSSSIVTYTPDADYFGPDSFTYTVSSSSGASATATVRVDVSPVNDPPVAVDDALSVNARQSIEINLATLVANDTDIDGGPLSVTSTAIQLPSLGGQLLACATPSPTCVRYVAPATPGAESIAYTVSDGAGGTDVGVLTITVRPIALPDDVFISMPCDNLSVSGPTTGITITRGFGVVLVRGTALLGSAGAVFRVTGSESSGFAYGWIFVWTGTAGRILVPTSITNPIGDTWMITGIYRVGRTVCPFQINVRDGG